MRAASLDGSIESLLDWKAVKKDDSFYTTAGTIHAIGPGLTLVEVQQNVDLTYRLYDYGSDRELHLDKGVEAADPVPYVAAYKPHEIAPGRDDPGRRAQVRARTLAQGGQRHAQERRPAAVADPAFGQGADRRRRVRGGRRVAGRRAKPRSTLDEGADMLVAYPKSGVIEGIWG